MTHPLRDWDLSGHATLYHGTSEAGYRKIRRDGRFKKPNVKAIVRVVAGRFGIAPSEIMQHSYFQHGSSTRVGDPRIYFTTWRNTAESYAKTKSEVTWDAIQTAVEIVTKTKMGHWEKREERNEMIAFHLHEMLGDPLVLELRVPWRYIAEESEAREYLNESYIYTEQNWLTSLGKANTIMLPAPVPAKFIVRAEQP